MVDLQQENMEKEGLARLVEELQQKIEGSARGNSRFLLRLIKTLEKKYITLATTIERYISPWCLAETSELVEGNDEVPERQWKDRVQTVEEFGLKLVKNTSGSDPLLFVPFPFTSLLTSKDHFYIPSFHSHESVLENLIAIVLEEPCWECFRSTPEIRKETIHNISTNHTMIGKVKQHLSDALSNRKRVVRDTLFSLLKYYNLRSCHERRKEVPLFEKTEEIKLAHQKLIPRIESGNKDYSRWRTLNITELTSDGSMPDILSKNSVPMDISNDLNGYNDEELSQYNRSVMGIHKNEISFHVWKEFLGYNPILNQDRPAETTFLSITRLDAWIFTVVELLVENQQRGGARQRDFSRSFHNNFKEATYQFISSVFGYVNYWADDELKVGDVVDGDFKEAVTSLERVATVILYSPVDETHYIAVRSDWFRKYISPNFGIVHDCYIAKISSDWRNIIPLVSNVGPVSQDRSREPEIFQEQPDPPVSNNHGITPYLSKTDEPSHDSLVDNSPAPTYEESDDDMAPAFVPSLPIP